MPDTATRATTVPGRILPAIALSQLAGTSLWFAINAVMPDLQRRGVASRDGWMADRRRAARLHRRHAGVRLARGGRSFLAAPRLSALLVVGATLAWLTVGLPSDLSTLLVLRFATGVCLAGIYPVGMKSAALTASNAPRALVGSVLTLVNSIGFAISTATIVLFVHLASVWPMHTVLPWLAVGPMIGVWCLRPLWR